jgi:hypothetical protein
MRRILVCAMALALGVIPATAQSLDDLNIQIHGYATQGFLYTTNNNILTTDSSNGSAEYTEAVVNLTAQPTPKLRIAVQARYELLGNYANDAVTIDYASADYKVDDKLGIRFGKVKVPSGLFNEISDIDPSYLWGLLPQSIYPLPSRNGQLSIYGGVAHGTLDLEKAGKIEYRGWSGDVEIDSNDGYFVSFLDEGINLPSGLSEFQNGAALHWRTPIEGLMIGASNIRTNTVVAPATVANGAVTGSVTFLHANRPDFFAKYEKGKIMAAVEYERLDGEYAFNFGGPAPPFSPYDNRDEYAMASYKLTGKLTAGTYYSQSFSRTSPLGPARFEKDWDVSGRYDFSGYLYAKAEEHFIDGTSINYDTDLNPGGLKPRTKFTILKVGVSF